MESDRKKVMWINTEQEVMADKYYIMICVTYILQQIYSAMLSMGIYYMMYVLNDENLFPIFSWAINIPLIIALLITPWLVAKWQGLYKLNLVGYASYYVFMDSIYYLYCNYAYHVTDEW